MSDEFSYIVNGRPVSWARTNIVRGRPMTDAKQRRAKQAHAWVAAATISAYWPGLGRMVWPLTGAFAVEVRGYWPDAKVADADRLASLALDALQGVAYETDRQVRRVVSEVHADGSPERVEVTVRRLAVDPVQPKKSGAAPRASTREGQARASGEAASKAASQPAGAVLSKAKIRALLAEGHELRRDIEARCAAMRRPAASDGERARSAAEKTQTPREGGHGSADRVKPPCAVNKGAT